MQRSGILPVDHFLGFLVVLVLVAAAPANADSEKRDSERRRSMTGTWETRTSAPFIIQRISGPTRHFTEMIWELTEDEAGLIIGVNSFESSDANGENPSRGSLCMVGARNQSRVVLSEGRLDTPDIPIFVFECTMRGRNQIRCLGSGLSTLEPIALHAVLVRSSSADPASDLCSQAQ